jgi:diaminohydroxyphosphoribosylaminopyrimidine deaminase/5-amino-6-(5-phosphoribosylamino)uracil reductase
MDDASYMRMALDLAQKGWGRTSPNPLVGAVIVRDGQILGKGYHEFVGGPHAEVNAIQDAGGQAKGATLYVTLEPCNHTGRTPPCTQAILKAGIARVVSAMDDPNPDVTGGGSRFLISKGVAVESGLLEQEARKLNEIFITYIKTKLPFVVLKCAATLDGRIATRTGDARWVSGEASRAYVHWLRHGLDAILVGIGTVKSDDPSLTTRVEGVQGKDPVRIILDTRLSIPETAKVLNLESTASTLIVTGGTVDEDKKNRLTGRGIKILQTPLKDARINMNFLMTHLGNIGITSVLIEGGSQVIASALNSGIVDKIMLFYAPKILGGDDGIPMCKGPGPEFMSGSIPVRHMTIRRFNEDVMIEGYMDKNEVR